MLLCSGKLYYTLKSRREEFNDKETAIIRLEQFYPFPQKQLKQILETCKPAKKWYWVQEEPENMGGWQFVRPRLEKVIGKKVAYIGRPEASSPATGFPAIFKQQQTTIIEKAIKTKGAGQNGQVS